MTGSKLNRLFPILLALADCNIALSEIPVLGEAQRSSVQLKDGYWAVAERDCSFDPAKPVENWPRCADWVVLDHNQIVRQRDNNVLGLAPTMLIADAHKAGLFVHAYTFRNEQRRLTADLKGDPKAEYLLYYRLGIDGLFSDFADTAIQARAMYLSELGR